MKWLLGKWAEQSAKLTTLDVHIERIDKDPKWKDEVHFEGRAVFKSPNLAYLDFKEVELTRDDKGRLAPVINPQNGKPVTTPTETIVCGRTEVWQYLFKGRQIFVFPLGKGERQRALDEGPLPFLFNMKAKEAEARYQMLFMGEDQKTYAVKIYPQAPGRQGVVQGGVSVPGQGVPAAQADRADHPGWAEHPRFQPARHQGQQAGQRHHLQGGYPRQGRLEGGPEGHGPGPPAGECRGAAGRGGPAAPAVTGAGPGAAPELPGEGVAASRARTAIVATFDRPTRRAYNHPGKPFD